MESATSKTGRKGFSSASMLCAFLVMKLERFLQITDLADYLENNKLIAYYCGFDITRNLPSYGTYDRFIQNLDHALLEKVMQKQVLQLVKMGYIYTSFIGLDSTPVMANTKQNNPKPFCKSKFAKANQPKI